MANSIVFQNNPSMLKAGIYGFDGSTYVPFPVTESGIKTIGNITGGTIGTVSVVSDVTTVANVTGVGTVDTVTKVGTVDTVTKVGTVDTVTKVAAVDAVTTVTNVATVVKVGTVDTVTKVAAVDAVTTVTEVTNVATVVKVGTVDTVTKVSTVDTVSTVTQVTNVGTVSTVSAVTTVTEVSNIANVSGTVNVSLVSGMDESTMTVAVIDTATGLTDAIDVSKYSDVSYYIYNTNAAATAAITLQMLAAPSSTLTFATINEFAVLTGTTPIIMTTDRFMKFNKIQATTTITTTQTLGIIMNGKY